MLGHLRGSIDPWHSKGEPCDPEGIWVEKEGPLLFMASLLSDWPDDVPTVDLDDEGRHLRFIQIVAGYPAIGKGMYPLDWPTHPTSIKALRLSLFLDSLPVPSNYSATPFHSVRSAILYLDSKVHGYGSLSSPEGINHLHSNCLTLLFRSIRAASKENDEFSELTADEAVFLNNLHSSDNDRDGRWITGWDEAINIKRDRKEPFDSNNMHTFKLSKIQKWMEKWTSPPNENELEEWHPLRDGVRQNLLSGASVLLESLFAQLRRHILTNYRPGSIITDGGGRITFYAKKDKADVEGKLKDFVEGSFIIDRDKYHPYNHIITQSLEKFGSGEICTKCPEEVPLKTNEQQQQDVDLEDGESLKECSHGTQFPQWEWRKINRGWVPRSGAYQRFLKNDVFPKRFFPPISYKHYDETKPPLVDYPLYEGCPMCKPSHPIEKRESNPFKIPGVCFPHALTFEIGKSYKRRDFSIRTKGKYNPEGAQVHSCAAIDINALGHLFTSPLSDAVIDELHKFEINERVGINKEKLMRVLRNKESIYWLNENIDFEKESDEEFRKALNKYSSLIRDRLVIFKSRKSFQFNAKWWISISKTLEAEPQTYLGEIGAWVAAGDDLLLVRRGEKSESNETLKEILKQLDVQLQEQFPKSIPSVSFCAGLEYREVGATELTIFQIIQKSKNYENICKDNWKTRARDSGRGELYTTYFGSEEKKKPFDESFLWKEDGSPIEVLDTGNERSPVESSMICVAPRGNKNE